MTTTDTPRTITTDSIITGDTVAVLNRTGGWTVRERVTPYQISQLREDDANIASIVLLNRAPAFPDAHLILIKEGDLTAGAPRPLPVLALRDNCGDYMDGDGWWWIKEDATITDWEPMTAVPTRLMNDLRDAMSADSDVAPFVIKAARNILKENQ